jgi:hypothetical protein
MRPPLRKAIADFFSRRTPSPQALRKQTAVIEWGSRFRPIQIRFRSPWVWALPPHDVENKTLIGLIDDSDGSHYTINVDNREVDSRYDIDAENLQDKLQTLNADHRNRLVAESDTRFHGSTYRFLRFESFTERWGRTCIDVFTRRTDTLFIAIQMSFQFEGERIDNPPPEKIIALNRDIRIYE